MPTVDVIIPAYNAARFLPQAIDSVVSQTFSDWRILLVDDGSTDKTAEVVAPYVTRLGPKLKYIRQANAGLPAARNAAIRNSSAELLALLDADDVWLPERLAESVKCFEGRPEVGLAYGFNSRIDADGAVIDTFTKRPRHAEGKIARYIYMRVVQLPCPTVTFSRKAVDEVGMFDETLRATEDRDLWVRIAMKYDVALVPKVIALYRISPNAMTTDPERMLAAQQQFIEKHYGRPGFGAWERRVALGEIYRQRAEAFALRREMRTAVGSSLRAVALNPLDVSNLRTAGSLLLRYAGTR
jgi:glycosyltransferase involved in cell wall biosynthesis